MFPEGLHLTYHDTVNYEPCIMDAQGVEWVLFPDHDTEDPIKWFNNIVSKTCEALGVTESINEEGTVIQIHEFIEGWCGYHEGYPGFTT